MSFVNEYECKKYKPPKSYQDKDSTGGVAASSAAWGWLLAKGKVFDNK